MAVAETSLHAAGSMVVITAAWVAVEGLSAAAGTEVSNSTIAYIFPQR
jgi:hypothetical protein